MMHPILPCLVALVLWSAPAIATPDATPCNAAWIETLDRPEGAVTRVMRAGKAMPHDIFMPLCTGDRLHVKGGGRIGGTLADDTAFMVENGKTLTIPAPPARRNPVFNILAHITAYLLDRRDNDLSDPLTTRGEEKQGARITFTVPGLAAETALLAEISAPRTIMLDWRGGRPPYTATLLHGGVAVDRVAGIGAERQARLRLGPGRGLRIVHVADGSGALAVTSIEVVDPAKGPPPALPPGTPMHDTLNALVLAAEAPGEWAFEARQRLLSLARTGYAPARIGAAMIGAGSIPAIAHLPPSERGRHDADD